MSSEEESKFIFMMGPTTNQMRQFSKLLEEERGSIIIADLRVQSFI